MAETVGSDRELDRHERLTLPLEELEVNSFDPSSASDRRVGVVVVQDVVDDRIAGDTAQEVIDDDPLVVPAHQPLRLLEEVIAIEHRAASFQLLDDLVVE